MIFHTPLASGKEKCSENPKCQFMFKDHFAEVMISVRQSSSLARLGFFRGSPKFFDLMKGQPTS